MQLNLSSPMLRVIVHALRRDIERGARYSCDNGDGYAVSNEEALELFEESLAIEAYGMKRVVRRTQKRAA